MLVKPTALTWAAFPILPVSQISYRFRLIACESEGCPSEFPSHATPALAIREHLATTAATTDVRGPCRTGIFRRTLNRGSIIGCRGASEVDRLPAVDHFSMALYPM